MASFDQKTLKRLWDGNGGSAEGPAPHRPGGAGGAGGGQIYYSLPAELEKDFRGNIAEDVGLEPWELAKLSLYHF